MTVGSAEQRDNTRYLRALAEERGTFQLRLVFPGKPDHGAIDRRQVRGAHQPHRHVELCRSQLDDALHTDGAERHQPPAGGRPKNTALAPSARAFSTSMPRRMPPSRRTGILPPTASTHSGSAISVGTAPSYARPPWFDTMIASAPVLHRCLGVLAVQDALDDDRQLGAAAQPIDVVPGDARRRRSQHAGFVPREAVADVAVAVRRNG